MGTRHVLLKLIYTFGFNFIYFIFVLHLAIKIRIYYCFGISNIQFVV